MTGAAINASGTVHLLPTLGREGKCVTLNIVRIKCNFLYMHMVLLQALLFIQGIQSSTQTDFWWVNEFAKDLRWVIFCTRHKLITLLSWWAVVMGPAVDSRIELLDVGIPVLKIDSEVRTAEHNSSTKWCYQKKGIQSLAYVLACWKKCESEKLPITWKGKDN